MTSDDLRERTKLFAIRIVKLVSALPMDRVGDVLGKQLLKSGTSLGANYREALRGSSRRHFITLLEIAQREADETLYWLEIIRDTGLINSHRLTEIISECRELLAIFTTTIVNTKQRVDPRQSKN